MNSDDLRSSYKNLNRSLLTLKQRYDRIEYHQERIHRDQELARQLAEQLEQELAITAQAIEVVHELALKLHNQAQLKIAAVGSKSLKIFGPEYSVRINFDVKRNRTSASFVVLKGDLELEPMDCGGGIIDVLSFALRLASIMADQPRRRLIILDEPFKYVSASFRPTIARLLERMTERFGLQFVIVTHLPELEIGEVVRINPA